MTTKKKTKNKKNEANGHSLCQPLDEGKNVLYCYHEAFLKIETRVLRTAHNRQKREGDWGVGR